MEDGGLRMEAGGSRFEIRKTEIENVKTGAPEKSQATVLPTLSVFISAILNPQSSILHPQPSILYRETRHSWTLFGKT
jgi:hypothetical protein